MTDGIAAVQARISEIQSMFVTPSAVAQATAAPSTAPTSGASSAFADALAAAAQASAAKGLDGATPASAPVAGAGSRESQVVATARGYLGIPYVWGGTDPKTGLDCSGFTQRVYKDVGIDIPRVSYEQATAGRAVSSLAQARPGDLVFYDYSSSRSGIDHVGMYIGNGKIINAPKPGDVVKISDVGNPVAIRRILPPATSTAPLAAGARPAAGGLAGVPYANLFIAAGAKHGVPAALLAAVAKTESGFNPSAVSSAGARGLMQFMPATATGLGINPMDPAQAVDGAARYLASNLRDFGSVDLALAAYNAGPGAVRRHHGIPPYTETQNYVTKVKQTWEQYR